MARLVKLLLFIGCLSVAAQVNFAPFVRPQSAVSENTLTNGLISYWRMDTNTWVDVLGENNLTNYNSPTAATGLITNALSTVKASQQFVATESITLYDDYSVAVWVKATDYSGASGVMAMSQDGSTGNRGFQLRLDATTYYPRFILFTNNYSAGNIQIVKSTSASGAWTHLVGVASLSTATASLYVNGELVETKSIAGVNKPSRIVQFAGNVQLGTYATGLFDEAALYNRALKSNEVSRLYNSGAGLTYPFQ